ncbi:MAG TPA: hypothetical protein DEA90_10110 [Opitutae bacterium]|nr:hypothetical protein [Puniceicoccaceae bacterium]HBR94506.1 hypothetical protein [Opitutae bacterium]
MKATPLESEYGSIHTYSHQNLIELYLKAGKVEEAEATARQLLDRLDPSRHSAGCKKQKSTSI